MTPATNPSVTPSLPSHTTGSKWCPLARRNWRWRGESRGGPAGCAASGVAVDFRARGALGGSEAPSARRGAGLLPSPAGARLDALARGSPALVSPAAARFGARRAPPPSRDCPAPLVPLRLAVTDHSSCGFSPHWAVLSVGRSGLHGLATQGASLLQRPVKIDQFDIKT